MAEEQQTEPRETLSVAELMDAWPALSVVERVEGFRLLPRGEEDDFFLSLPPFGQAQLLAALPESQRRIWMRLLAPDDAADVVQQVEGEKKEALLCLLDDSTRREVNALLAYSEDHAGGLMSPRFARVRPDMRIDEAVRYLQKQAREHLETIYYAYALDSEQKLAGVCSFRELFAASPDKTVRDVMHTDPVVVREDMDQEAVARLFQQHGFLALPVLDRQGRMEGIVTIDDIVDVVQEEATEDVQKFGGMEALDAPYLQTAFWEMIRKRAGWLAILFVGEMLTASAMSVFEDEIAKAVVLAMFVPLIISSGGNSGSQASTLIIRAMALGEVKLRDWWLIVRRELSAGMSLGVFLACIGAVRIMLWHFIFGSYGEHWALVMITVATSLVGIVTWGTLSGAMLPFILRKAKLDPASASAPFVATLVDVSGLIIYFSVAKVVMGGTLL
jgi:magnesium transporter